MCEVLVIPRCVDDTACRVIDLRRYRAISCCVDSGCLRVVHKVPDIDMVQRNFRIRESESLFVY